MQVNFFAGAYYDAVTWYGNTIKEIVLAGGDILDGRAVARNMWDRNFIGNVSLSMIIWL